MTPTPEAQERIRRYLLGQLGNGAQEGFEQELLTNQEMFEELSVVEDEIIDEYLVGKLSDEERAGFEGHFLATPERHEKLRFARAFSRYVAVASPQGKPANRFFPAFLANQSNFFQAAVALVVLAAAAGSIWFALAPRSSPKTFVALTLTISAGTRDEGAKASRVPLPINADALRIALELPEQSLPAQRYRAVLQSVAGGEKSLEPVAQEAQSVTVVIPAAELQRGEYSLKLFAVRADGEERRINGSYLFTVE